MGLPIARVKVGIVDGITAINHPAIAHIDAHMRNARRVVGSRKENQIAGLGVVCPGGYVVEPLRSQPPEVPAALIINIGNKARTVKRGIRVGAAPDIGKAQIFLRLGKNGGKGFIGQIALRDIMLVYFGT